MLHKTAQDSQFSLRNRSARPGPGTVFAQLLAATITDPEAAARLRDRFLSARRAEVARLWQRAVELGEAGPGVPADVAIDVLFSPIVYRLLVGHAPFGAAQAAQLADAALSGLLTPATPSHPSRASSGSSRNA